jgi:hypothetical protein
METINYGPEQDHAYQAIKKNFYKHPIKFEGLGK